MAQVDGQSIQDSLRKGTLVELSSDYRTAITARTYLPEPAQCAMSTTAFRRHVLQGKAGEKQSRVEAICEVLSSILKLTVGAAESRFEFRFFGEDGRAQSHPLKLEWFAPNKYWVVLLPEENLRTVMKSG